MRDADVNMQDLRWSSRGGKVPPEHVSDEDTGQQLADRDAGLYAVVAAATPASENIQRFGAQTRG